VTTMTYVKNHRFKKYLDTLDVKEQTLQRRIESLEYKISVLKSRKYFANGLLKRMDEIASLNDNQIRLLNLITPEMYALTNVYHETRSDGKEHLRIEEYEPFPTTDAEFKTGLERFILIPEIEQKIKVLKSLLFGDTAIVLYAIHAKLFPKHALPKLEKMINCYVWRNNTPYAINVCIILDKFRFRDLSAEEYTAIFEHPLNTVLKQLCTPDMIKPSTRKFGSPYWFD